jgi:hypothetical protein
MLPHRRCCGNKGDESRNDMCAILAPPSPPIIIIPLPLIIAPLPLDVAPLPLILLSSCVCPPPYSSSSRWSISCRRQWRGGVDDSVGDGGDVGDDVAGVWWLTWLALDVGQRGGGFPGCRWWRGIGFAVDMGGGMVIVVVWRGSCRQWARPRVAQMWAFAGALDGGDSGCTLVVREGVVTNMWHVGVSTTAARFSNSRAPIINYLQLLLKNYYYL